MRCGSIVTNACAGVRKQLAGCLSRDCQSVINAFFTWEMTVNVGVQSVCRCKARCCLWETWVIAVDCAGREPVASAGTC
jgi:hypothetical protein